MRYKAEIFYFATLSDVVTLKERGQLENVRDTTYIVFFFCMKIKLIRPELSETANKSLKYATD